MPVFRHPACFLMDASLADHALPRLKLVCNLTTYRCSFVDFSCVFCICISFYLGLRTMGENPIMGQHENRGESRNVSNASKYLALVHALMSVPAPVDQAQQTRDDVTTLLRDWRNGNQSALNRLTPLIYEDLIRLARARLAGERRELTVDPTALGHECYLRLADQTRLDVESRAHLYSIPADLTRPVLIP